MMRAAAPLSQSLARRFAAIAALVFALNALGVGIYYGTDRRVLVEEAANGEAERMEDALAGDVLPSNAPVRALYADHPRAYGFALVGRGGQVLDAMNADLIPSSALELYADDWVTQIDRPDGVLSVVGHKFAEREDGLRMVFVMANDPARLVWRAYLDELYEHVWLPIFPLAILMIGAGVVLIRRSLRPLAEASAWARDLRPGDPPRPPPKGRLPAEIADLVDATRRALERLAEALNAEKRRAGEAAHALRTPVAVLVARLDTLPAGETTDRLRADVDHLSRTVRQVLDAGRADALQMPRAAPLDLRVLAEAATSALAPFAHAEGATLALEMPDAAVPARADAEAVELALTNLIENAVLHGGGAVTVTVGPGPTIAVSDDGPGLPPDAGERLFEPFWRAPGARPGGTGLGLAIVDRLQRAQGGAVAAETATGGALFRLTFPGA